ncbi:tubulin delta chain isoform X3 [Echeneis naucrates]|uniref:tubulin delta chain isoform X3 n=1 Tax=Echeneis naucrates TaxID=173247 RepID=UPI0011135566|nr:tubulin delta chain isoform X3 [Echeneis naucrates]
MSMVTLQLGQCGNQIGPDLFGILSSDALHGPRRSYGAASRERFFHSTAHGDLVARAVLIDMEPKVIKQSMAKAAASGTWRYGDASHFSQKQGSGNNWANGYCVHGPRHREVVEELVRREVERCDRLAGLMAMMSVAGGTGSGVGTYITQCLRDTYAKSFILNHLTWPYRTGEVIVQNYNSVLTLAHLYQLSDAILVHENDMVHKICSQLLNIKHISFSDVNRVIAHQMGSVLQPSLSADSHGDYSRNPLGELVSTLACHPEYKLLSVCTIPQMPSSSIAYSTFSWPGLLKHLRQMLISNSKMEEGIDWHVHPHVASERPRSLTGTSFNVSLANLLILRGKDVFSTETGRSYRAYIHQYIKFGISEEDFLESFTSLEQVIASYTQLS